MTNQNAVATIKPPQSKASALTVMANRLSVEPEKILATLKATVFQKATNEEMLALVVVANEYGLNPFLKELYAFPAKGGGIVPIVSVDGWNKMLLRQEQFDGIEFEMTENEQTGLPHSCTAIIYVKGRSRPVKVTEYFDECYRKTEPWENMPRRMLRNRTLCQASRMAFGFAGVYNEDEAHTIIDISSPPPKRVALVASTESANEQTAQGQQDQKPAETKEGPCEELAELVIKEGFTFDHFRQWGVESGQVGAADWTGFADLKVEDAKRFLRAKTGLLRGLETAKGGQS